MKETGETHDVILNELNFFFIAFSDLHSQICESDRKMVWNIINPGINCLKIKWGKEYKKNKVFLNSLSQSILIKTRLH